MMRKLLALFLMSSFMQATEQPSLILFSSSSEESANDSESDEDSIVNALVLNASNLFTPAVEEEVDVPEIPCTLEYDSRERSQDADTTELQFLFDEYYLNGFPVIPERENEKK